jgi:uncharacterized membrane protein YdjX (TVP38/TMEM64 family)
MQQELLRIIDWIAEQEHSFLLFILIYAFATVLGLPGSPFTLAAAILFGFWKGLIAVLIGANAGAALAFLCARYLARDWIEKRVKARVTLANFDQAIKRSGWRIVLLLRLAPIFPFNALNYALGLSGISFRDYLIATIIGIIPGTIAYIYVGSLIGDLAKIGAERSERTPLEWAVSIVGLFATAAAVIYIVRLAKKHLHQSNTGAASHQPG